MGVTKKVGGFAEFAIHVVESVLAGMAIRIARDSIGSGDNFGDQKLESRASSLLQIQCLSQDSVVAGTALRLLINVDSGQQNHFLPRALINLFVPRRPFAQRRLDQTCRQRQAAFVEESTELVEHLRAGLTVVKQ